MEEVVVEAVNDEAYPLRLPSELKEEIRQVARSQERSLNGEIIVAIRRHVNAYKGAAKRTK